MPTITNNTAKIFLKRSAGSCIANFDPNMLPTKKPATINKTTFRSTCPAL